MKFIQTKVKYLERTFLTEYILEAVMELGEDVEYEPGQFANILVEEKAWRSYSIAGLEGNKLTFIVDIRPGGPGSIFFKSAKIGTEVDSIVPMGRFLLKDLETPKLMVATGTGIAPYIPMSKSLLASGFSEEILILWGIRYDHDYYINRYLNQSHYSNLKIIPAVTKGSGVLPNEYKGRVTKFLSENTQELSNYDAYICGNPRMVTEVYEILNEKGLENIQTEKY